MPRDDELAQTATAPASAAETVGSGPVPARALALPKLGRFELETVLGKGGMGVVHAAYDPELERRVAVKVLHGKNADARARLLREARAMAKLSHANVITVFDVGTADGEDFVAMELIDGGTLGEWIERSKPRPRDVIAAFVAAGRGLAAAHAEGLVHRDFKPSNVLRSHGGRIIVTDFGLARAEGADGRTSRPSIVPQQQTTAPALTKTGSLLGTPAYMAPEQWRFEAVTPATDQFAFCVALWEALSGQRPFVGATLDDLREDVLDGPTDLDDAGLPRRLRPVLRRGLAIDPAQRWPSMSALLGAIEGASSRRSIAAIAGIGLAAVGVAIYVAAGAATARAPACVQPAIDPDTVSLTPGAAPYVERWRTAREAACKATREVRVPRLACLDAVFARIADAFHDRSPGPDALADLVVEPEVCGADPPPHLRTTIGGPMSAAFAAIRADVAVEADQPGDALVAYEHVLARHAAAGRTQAELGTALELMRVHLERSNPEDLDAVIALAARYAARARAVGRGAGIAVLEARARWRLGQVDAANLEARAAGPAYSEAALADSPYEPQHVLGTVIDEHGTPVANATVVAGSRLWGDDAGLSSPVAAVATVVETTTNADGSFELVGARKMAMASHGDQVSLPVALAPNMTLTLGPTSTVEGDVALGSEPFSRVRVGIFIYGDKTSQLHAGPVDRAGHFKLARIPRGKQQIAAMLLDQDTPTAQDLDVSQPVLTGVHVWLPTKRTSNNVLYIIGRSETATPPDAAMAFVSRGAHPNLKGSIRAIMPIDQAGTVVLGQRDPAQLAPAYKGHVEADDLTGELRSRPDEDVTICVVGLSNKLLATITSAADAVRMLGDGDAGCAVVSPTQAFAVVMIPAIKRR